MPSMRHTPSRGCYGRLVMHGPIIDEDEPEEESPHQGSVGRPTCRISRLLRRCSMAPVRPKLPRWWQKFGEIFNKGVRFGLTNIIVSVNMLLFGLVLSLGPGIHTLLQDDPGLVIDKSIKAFNIPNHIVTRRQDAFTEAVSEYRRSHTNSRGRRDLDSVLRNSHHGNTDKNKEQVPVWNGKDVQFVHKEHFRSHLKKSLEKFYHNEEDDHIGQSAPSSDRIRNKRSSHSLTRIAGITQAYRRWKMTLIYLARGADDHNMFTHERIETVHQVERRIMNHTGFSDFCYISYLKLSHDVSLKRYGGCAPLNSLLTYFYPSQTPEGTVHYDGLGSKLDHLDRTLSFAMTRDTFFWYVDDKINSTYRRSRLLRSEVHFGAPLPGYTSFTDKQEEQTKKFQNFIISFIDMLEKASTDKVMILYGGNELFDYEVDSTFWSDVKLAFFTFGFILIFMFVLTSFSLWMTFWGMVSIILSFPLALFMYREVFGVVSLGILNGAAAFLIIGIGVDDIFVFINTFRQAHHMTDVGDRLVHTVYTAGKATFFTSFTTAAAFAANVASSIPAIHDFGLFMSLIVSCCWVMVVIMMPPVINIWVRCFAPCEARCYQGCIKCKQTSSLKLPSDIAHFLDTKCPQDVAEVAGSPKEPSEDDGDGGSEDVPLLQLEDVNAHDGGWPIYLGMLNQMLYEEEDQEGDDPLLQLETELTDTEDLEEEGEETRHQPGEGCSLTAWMQAVLYHFVAKPVVRWRWFVLGGYIIIFVTSVGLMTQLHTATRPPQLFREDTNLQRIMDLAANFSDSAITCDECSAFFKESPVKLPTETDPTSITPSPITSPVPLPAPASSVRTTVTTASTSGHPVAPLPDYPTMQKTQPPWHGSHGFPAHDLPHHSKPTVPAIPIIPVTFPAHYTANSGIHGPDPKSVDSTFDPCAGGRCKSQKSRPNLELGAVVHVVFGIKGIDRTNVSMEHVLTERGTVEYDEDFAEHFQLRNLGKATAIRDLCRLCKLIANNTKLVKPNGSQCVPQYGLPIGVRQMLRSIPECQNLPENKIVNGHRLPARAIARLSTTGIQWIAFAFESTTFKGQSYFTAYNEYNEWETYIAHLKTTVLPSDSPLRNFYQTSEFWTNVMMEVVAVSSAIYGLVLSMIICIMAVAIFTGHVKLLLIVGMTILGVICLVVAIFYLAGWEMGAVEAVSLSILVGSSVDYCVHVVEGYLLAGRNPPAHVKDDPGKLRQWRTLAAVSHIGVSITSSALTTIVAAIPLTRTVIQPFSKFGQIVTINTSMSILYTLTACIAFLSLLGPAHHNNSLRSTAVAFTGTLVFTGLLALILYILSRCGINIPAPSGDNLFP